MSISAILFGSSGGVAVQLSLGGVYGHNDGRVKEAKKPGWWVGSTGLLCMPVGWGVCVCGGGGGGGGV